MKKKQIANLVMVAIIVVIAAAGFIFVGHTQGSFDKNDGAEALLCDVTGVITLERNGVSYPVEKDTVLRAGDKLKCNAGATGRIEVGDSSFVIGEKAELSVSDAKAENFKALVKSGEVFLNCSSAITLAFDDKEIKFAETTALLSVREGAQSISVLRGTVDEAASGKVINFTEGKELKFGWKRYTATFGDLPEGEIQRMVFRFDQGDSLWQFVNLERVRLF